ncbi:MAG: SH3 domain-containing protein [Anaerolineales bacterium]|nr:SH3 domain-containing protein [Anaerolineales bacterium]
MLDKGKNVETQRDFFDDPAGIFRLLQAGSAPPASAATSTGAPMASAALPPTLTPIPTLTSTPTLTPSPTPFAPFNVTAMVDNLNFRTNPGYLFPVIRMYKQGTTFSVLGKAPGGEWFYVWAPENIEGWVFGMLLESNR